VSDQRPGWVQAFGTECDGRSILMQVVYGPDTREITSVRVTRAELETMLRAITPGYPASAADQENRT
jgi:hypothetical protein